jgi:hypothetical protein
MAMSTTVKIAIGVGVVGIAYLLYKKSATPAPGMPGAANPAAPSAGIPTNAQIIANAAPQLIAAMQSAISPPVQSPTTSANP